MEKDVIKISMSGEEAWVIMKSLIFFVTYGPEREVVSEEDLDIIRGFHQRIGPMIAEKAQQEEGHRPENMS